MKTAILIDGRFFCKRIDSTRQRYERPAEEIAQRLEHYCQGLIEYLNETEGLERELFQIFYYDCPPAKNDVPHVMSATGKQEIGNSPSSKQTTELLKILQTQRKLTLRLGRIAEEQAKYVLRHESLEQLVNKKIEWNSITKKDFKLDIKQKGVDTRIAVDIATLALKKQVDQIILIANDSDFTPAVELAIKENVEVILDILGESLKPYFLESVSWLISDSVSKKIMNKAAEYSK